MWSLDIPSRLRTGLLVAVLLSAALAGCFGGEDDPKPSDDPDNTGVGGGGGGGTGTNPGTGGTGTTGGNPSGGDDENETEPEVVPEAHYHHHWGKPPLDEVIVFEGSISLDAEACTSTDHPQRPPCRVVGNEGQTTHIGSAVFDLESDGDQVNDASSEPTDGGHADTIFSGTSVVRATFTWEDDLVGDVLRFYYRPANSPDFIPRTQLDESPIYITKEDNTHEIEIKPGMADPAHQYWVSRWSFMLVAEGGPQEDWQAPIKLANGTVDIEMVAVNGGKESIDPPHPDPWKGRDQIAYPDHVTGSLFVTAASAEQGDAGATVLEGEGFDDIQMPERAIVPAGTEKVEVHVWLNGTDEASKNMDWTLMYHGANTVTYTRLADATEGAEGQMVFEIYVEDPEVDPPYEKQSYFRYGITPVVADQQDIGVLQAEYSMKFTVHKRADFTFLM